MKSFIDFTEPSRKIEYQEQPERFNVTTNHVKLPFSSEVIAKSIRDHRAKDVSPLLKSFLNGSIVNEVHNTYDKPRDLSDRAKNARNEVLKRLGIER